MAAETQYIANTGLVTISTANPNLDGTGAFGTVIKAADLVGLLIKTIIVKAAQSTTQGVVRLFINDGTNTKLLKEIEVPAVIASATDPTFEIFVPVNFYLEANWYLYASTQNAETFNIIAEAQDWHYHGAAVRFDTTEYSAYNAATTVSTANANLDGSGALGTALVSSGGNIMAVTIKAMQSTTAGMVRLFLYNGSINRLFAEIPIPAITQSAIAPTFYHRVVFNDGFALKTGWQLKASTQKAESFNIIPELLNWTYPA